MTTKSNDQAAALIQARVRGYQYRQREHKAIKGITKLQARQRGRYTRKEYAKLLEFYNEQDSFLMQAKQRQHRILQEEQELYFLKHTTVEHLEQIHTFQYNRSAKVIQRKWRRTRQVEQSDQEQFDPFGFLVSNDTSSNQDDNDVDHNRMERVNQLLSEPMPSFDWLPVLHDQEAMTNKRKALQERLVQMRKEQEQEKIEVKGGVKSPLPRRELCKTYMQLSQATSSQLQTLAEKYSSQKRDELRDHTVRMVASCRARLDQLTNSKQTTTLMNAQRGSALIERQRKAFEMSTASWSEVRKQRAWQNHTQIMNSVWKKEKWYDTYLAGIKQDIRHVVAPIGCGLDQEVLHCPPSSGATIGHYNNEIRSRSNSMDDDNDVLYRYIYSIHDDDQEMDDKENITRHKKTLPNAFNEQEASKWWRAHASQSHLAFKHLDRHQYPQNIEPQNADAQITRDMLTNPDLYKLHQRVLQCRRSKEVEQSVSVQLKAFEQQIHARINQVEQKKEFRTCQIQEEKVLAMESARRQTIETHAASHIQRHVRGYIGRKHAQTQKAKYFVMVRGRAIRKGKCEECGAQRAVLECHECEGESVLHLCPGCWVHVHSTRRRERHVAIPMVVENGSDLDRAKGKAIERDAKDQHQTQ